MVRRAAVEKDRLSIVDYQINYIRILSSNNMQPEDRGTYRRNPCSELRLQKGYPTTCYKAEERRTW